VRWGHAARQLAGEPPSKLLVRKVVVPSAHDFP
jgi:hypothetical protein